MNNEKSIIVSGSNLDVGSCPIAGLCQSDNLNIADYQGVITIDFRQTRFVTISQAAAVVQILKDRQVEGLKSKIHPPADENAKRYMERMNFYRLINTEVHESFIRHDPKDRFIPMEALEDESTPTVISDKLKAMLETCAPDVDTSIHGCLHFSFGEIMDNVVQHSETPSYGVATAQYYPSQQFVELCVVDGGKGVVASLRENPRYQRYSDTDLAVMAFQEKVGQFVGRPDFANNKVSMGRGLHIASRVVAAMGGYLWMVSHDILTEVSKDGSRARKGYYFPGTLVVARLPIKPGVVVLGSDISDKFADSPVSWEAEEGGFFYSDGREENLLW